MDQEHASHQQSDGLGDPTATSSSPQDPPAKRRRPSTTEPTNRVQLACFYCRTKRIRCSGTKPTCEACLKVGGGCEWPEGRAKKRTKKEMEEAKRREGEKDIGTKDWQGFSEQSLSSMVAGPPDYYWTSLNASNQYLWPQDLTAPGVQTASPNMSHLRGQALPIPRMAAPSSGSRPLHPPLPPIQPNLCVSPPSSELTTMPASTGDISLSGPLGGSAFDGILDEGSPNKDARLANALEAQTAYIDGNPEGDGNLELFYYRFSGSTAIHPGINRISLKLQRRSFFGAPSPLAAVPQPIVDSPTDVSPLAPPTDLFDSTGMPHEHVWRPYFALYFKYMSQHFPNCSYQRMIERFETGTMSQFLACCICSLAARFDPSAQDPTSAAAPFIAKAQELVTPLLHLPTHDVFTGLLYLAWSNYGQNSESGLWQYSGMAMRMAIDLGAHEVSELYESVAHRARIKLLFWSTFVTDRIVAFATGRPASIPEDIIEIPLPVDEDFFPDPSRNFPDSAHEPVEPVPYVQLIQLMVIVGRISNVLNGRRGRALTLVSSAEPLPELIQDLQVRLITFYANLPTSLKWSADNFKHQHARGHSGTFLALHLWANAVLALIYHPELLKSPSGVETPLNKSLSRNAQLSLASSRQIVECMVFADLVDSASYVSCYLIPRGSSDKWQISSPYLTQPLFVAGMAFIHEMRALNATAEPGKPMDPSRDGSLHPGSAAAPNPTDILMLSRAKQNFSTILHAVYRLEEYWAGAHYVATLLEKSASSLLLAVE
ncbi:hypothetical protein, variant 1 [Cryptococcus amylolentus CBS 6039]|uniref:Zn(2)-C6 fungal-type domain-containing protein n=1 Tax=Cryptococcus amylolentus CBS 6039 TaxID=1295533 RepID=A0A1E3I2U0_9TREE|nr:hypothetical protein, variant 1 [Cryptococcus amylolentus CBS 6039]ODN82869.1 hypothetical protein, variant 1 [Cryptococcus amylolentus CBS 6039]